MRIELLYFDGCPNHDELQPHLRRLLADAGLDHDIDLVRIDTLEQAERARFLGSPTVRVEGVDVDPTAGERRDFGMKCRIYHSAEGLRGTPPDEWILDALVGGPGLEPGTSCL
jgi:hypothetical protein